MPLIVLDGDQRSPECGPWEPLYKGKSFAGVDIDAAHYKHEIARLEAECFSLSAGQCPNVTGDEGGTPRCAALLEAVPLLRRAVGQLSRWQEWYGAEDYSKRGRLSVPPAGDVRLAEDIDEFLTARVSGPNVL